MAFPIKNNVWSNYFEDVPIKSDTQNVNQLNAGETARYLMQHPEFDPGWETHARAIIKWIETTFGVQAYGATTIQEQQAFVQAYGQSHVAVRLAERVVVQADGRSGRTREGLQVLQLGDVHVLLVRCRD